MNPNILEFDWVLRFLDGKYKKILENVSAMLECLG